MSTAPPIRPGDRATSARGAVQPRWRRLLPPTAVVGTVAAAAVALHVRDPHVQGSWGVCPTKALFGIDCPGCGGLRAVNDLTNLQFIDAASSNLLLVASIPFLAYVLIRWGWGRWSTRSWSPSDRAMSVAAVSIVALLVLFTVLRNTPAGSWLAP